MLTTGELSQAQKEFVQKSVMMQLDSLKDDVLFRFAEKVNFEPTSDEYSWRMYKDLPKTTSHLIEGITPDGLKYSLVDFAVKVYQEGNFVPLTDKMLKYGIDKQLAISGKLLGKNARTRLNELLSAVVFNGLNVRYANSAANRSTVASSATYGPTLADLNAIKADFVRRGVEPVEGGKYIFLASPEIIAAIKNLDSVNKSWMDVEKYGDQSGIINGEVGTFLGFRFVESNIVPVVSTNVHQCLAFGKEAFGVVAINGEDAAGGFDVIYHAPGEGGSSDPLNQRGSLGWKHNGFGARILRDEAMVRYEVYGAAPASALTDSSRIGYCSASGTISPTLTAGTNTTISIVGNVAPGNLIKATVAATTGHTLASTKWTTGSFVGVDIIQGAASDASIFVQVKKNASSVTLVSANAAS